jgi:nicotinamide-nucleotide amidase
MTIPTKLIELADQVLETARLTGATIATAESCTGGLVAVALTEIPGSSDVVDRGFVTYSNAAKTDLLGVDVKLIDDFGAVSKEVALAMADGALSRSDATLTVSVTGIAGPSSDRSDKPVGLVWFALAMKGRATKAEKQVFDGRDRCGVREAAAEHALTLLSYALSADR